MICSICGGRVRRLPAPWRAEKIPGGYVVRDANGQALAYVYSRATETDANKKGPGFLRGHFPSGVSFAP